MPAPNHVTHFAAIGVALTDARRRVHTANLTRDACHHCTGIRGVRGDTLIILAIPGQAGIVCEAAEFVDTRLNFARIVAHHLLSAQRKVAIARLVTTLTWQTMACQAKPAAAVGIIAAIACGAGLTELAVATID